MRTPRARPRAVPAVGDAARHRRLGGRLAAFALAAGLVLSGCTEEAPTEEPTPPAAPAEPAPAGLRVGVVLAIEGGGTDTVGVDRLRDRLEELGEQRSSEVSDLRVVVPDDRDFTGDVAALLAGDGLDLVCLLGDVSGTVVVDLGQRFPATRFCAIGTDREGLPDNVQLIQVAQEELGFALGAAVEALAGDGRAAVLTADDSSARTRRREGVRRALQAGELVTVELPRDRDGELDRERLDERLEAAEEDDGPLEAYLLDGPSDLVAAAADTLPDGSVVAPARGTVDLPSVVVRFRIDVAAIVVRALDRLVDEEPADLGEVGFEQGAFVFELDERAEAAADALDTARERLVAGLIDLDDPPPAPPTDDDTDDTDDTDDEPPRDTEGDDDDTDEDTDAVEGTEAPEDLAVEGSVLP